MAGDISAITFEDKTCQLERYTKAYFDCSKSSRANENHFFKNFRNDNPFPVFTRYIFKKEVVPYPYYLFDFKDRTGSLDNTGAMLKPGKTIVLKRKNVGRNTNHFFIWISQSLWEKYLNQTDGKFSSSIHILFHPVGNIGTDYPDYYDESKELQILQKDNQNDNFYKNNKYYDTNFFELGVRYLFKEKQSVLQHRCAISRSDIDPAKTLKDAVDCIPIMLIVPVSGINPYFGDLATAPSLQQVMKAISNFCFEIAQKEKGHKPDSYPTVNKVACSFYSRSGDVAERLITQLPTFIDEFYLFDVMLDKYHIDKNTKKRVTDRTQEEGFKIVWNLFKQWKKDNPNKKIRIYSAYPNSVSFITSELKMSKHEQNLAKFSSFNNQSDRSGNSKYSGLSDGYEIYNADASMSLVCVPTNNFLVYLDETKNSGGFVIDDNYMSDVGHSWFLTRMQTHALFHSGFIR